MSTLRVTNVQDTAGANSLTTAQIYNGAAKAWVNFNAQEIANNNTGIRASFNVDIIEDNGIGDYTVKFTNPMPDANYCMAGSGQTHNFTTTAGRGYAVSPFSSTISPYLTTSLRVQGCLIDAGFGVYGDSTFFNVAVFR